MDQSNMIAQEIESHGVRTFSAKEMAFNILGLMHPILFSITQVEPVWGDLSGGFGRIADLADMASRIRVNMNKKAELRRAIARDNAAEFKIINGAEAERVLQTVNITLGPISVSNSPNFLGHIPFSHFLSYVTSLTWIKSSSFLALVKLGHGDLRARGGRWRLRAI
jgi:hypothetical protein